MMRVLAFAAAVVLVMLPALADNYRCALRPRC